MADPQIRLKRSSVSSKRPALENVALGEFAINTYDGNLFTRQDTGGVGIATTVTNLTPWQENYGGTAISYGGDARIAGILTIGSASITLDPVGRLIKGIDEVIIGNGTTISIKQDAEGQIQFQNADGSPAGFTIGSINVSGVSTLANTVIGGGTTELLVNGDANVVGILTVGDDLLVDGDLNITGIVTGTATIASTLITPLVDNTVAYQILDDISQSFDGVTTQFVVRSSGAGFLNAEIVNPARLMISVGGILQEPDLTSQRGYNITAGTDRTGDPLKVVFAEAPKYGETFFGVAYGLGIEAQSVYISSNEALVNSIVFGV